MGVKVAASLFIGQNVLINPSMADLDALALLHPSRYLFRTPIFSQFLFYHFPGRHRDQWLGFRPETDLFLMCLLWTIAALTVFRRNSRLMVDLCTSTRNLVSLFLGKLSVSSHKCSFDLAVLEPMLLQLTSPSTAFVALMS